MFCVDPSLSHLILDIIKLDRNFAPPHKFDAVFRIYTYIYIYIIYSAHTPSDRPVHKENTDNLA